MSLVGYTNSEVAELMKMMRDQGVIVGDQVMLSSLKDYGKFALLESYLSKLLSQLAAKDTLKEQVQERQEQLKDQMASEASRALFHKIRAEVAMPLLNKPIAQLSSSITNKVFEQLDKHKAMSLEERLRMGEQAALEASRKAASKVTLSAKDDDAGASSSKDAQLPEVEELGRSEKLLLADLQRMYNEAERANRFEAGAGSDKVAGSEFAHEMQVREDFKARMAEKYGQRAAVRMLKLVLPRALPGVNTVLLVKDAYEFGQFVLSEPAVKAKLA